MKLFENQTSKVPHMMQYNAETDLVQIVLNRVTSAGVDLSKLHAGITTNLKGTDHPDRILQWVGDDRLTTQIQGDTLLVRWRIGLNTSINPGCLQFVLDFRDDNGAVVWHDRERYLVIDKTMTAESLVAQYPSLFVQYEAAMRKLYADAQAAVERAEEQAGAAADAATEATAAKNAAVEQAQAASTSKDEATKASEEVRRLKLEAEQSSQSAAQVLGDCQTIKQQVAALMATDTKSYFFSTLAERDEAEGMCNCDRCSVFETRADYIYDDHDIDADGVNPEWVKTSDWDALKTVAWEIITGKPAFAAVATSGSYNDLSDKPRRYEQFITLTDGNWDYSLSDKAVITLAEDTAINITNLYNGAVGLIKVYGAELILPEGSKQSIDFDYVQAASGEHYTYTFVYDGAALCWARTVCINGE